MTRSSLSRTLGLAAALSFGFAGAAAAQSGTVTVYASQATAEKVVELFEAKYPEIDVNLLHLVTGPLATRFSNEAETGVNAADVLIIATPSIFHTHPEWFLKLPEIDSAAYDAWNEALKTDTYVRATIGKAVILYNTDLVSPEDAPTTWQDLLTPRFAGKISVIDPSSSDTYMSWALNMRKAFGDQYLIDLGKQNPIISGGGLDAAQAVASGAVDVSVPPFATHATNLIEQGAPVGIANIPGPSLGNLTSIGLPANAPNAENAKLFFEFYLSPEGQSAACGGVSASGYGELDNCEALPADFIPPSFDIPSEDVEAILTLLGIRK